MEAKHTPEPWATLRSADDEHMWIDDGPGNLIAEVFDDKGNRDANAARIVACVNGCAGIADPSAVGDMLDAVQLAEAAIEDMMRSTGGALIVQDYGRLNDALLACRRSQVKAGIVGIGALLREPALPQKDGE